MRGTRCARRFPEHAYLPKAGFLQYVVEDWPLRLIALDTLVEGKGHGVLCPERLDWLEARLGESDRATMLFMHHPPFERRHRTVRCGAGAARRRRTTRGAGPRSRQCRTGAVCGHVHTADPGPLGRHDGIDRAQHGPSGDAGPARGCQAVDDHGSAGRGGPSVATGHRPCYPCELCRLL